MQWRSPKRQMNQSTVRIPYWWDIAGHPEPTPVEELPREVDVLVVGAGLTGLSAARTLATAGRSVLVLDQGSPGIGASSRNGGMIGGGHRVHADELVGRYGHELAAAQLREMHIDSVEFAKRLMATEEIECDFDECGRFLAMWLASDYEAFARNLDQVTKLAPVSAEMIPRADTRDEVATDLYCGGAVYHFHGGLNPAKWVAGILKAAIRRGALVQGDTPVQALERVGAAHIATTPRGLIRAGSILLATNGYTDGRFGTVGRSVFPVPSFLITTDHLGSNRVRALFPTSRMIVETRERHCYYRPVSGRDPNRFRGTGSDVPGGPSVFCSTTPDAAHGAFSLSCEMLPLPIAGKGIRDSRSGWSRMSARLTACGTPWVTAAVAIRWRLGSATRLHSRSWATVTAKPRSRRPGCSRDGGTEDAPGSCPLRT